jgi:hypothetical protein
MTATAIVPTGVVVICCGDHRLGGCCDAVDCAPCCPECPTCPTTQHNPPALRAGEAAVHRALLADLAEWAHNIRRAPWTPEVSVWPTSSP